MKHFLKAYKNLSDLSVTLLLLGTKLSLCVLIIGIIAYKYNELFIGSYGNEMFCLEIVQTSWNMFVIFVLGGLALDCREKFK